jgi:ComF family protein
MGSWKDAVASLSGFLDLFYPPACVACDRLLETTDVFCGDCAVGLEPLGPDSCARCAEPGHFEDECSRCMRTPPPFNEARAPFVHGGPLARAIHRFKYEDHPELARPLTRLAVRHGKPFLSTGYDVLCAVPLHGRRFRERKYDQAQLLAVELAGHLGLPCDESLLRRTKATRRQVGLSEHEREQNVSGAFEGSARARGRHLLLVDDVFTTGATARAAAQALLAAGAASVDVFTLARAPSSP